MDALFKELKIKVFSYCSISTIFIISTTCTKMYKFLKEEEKYQPYKANDSSSYLIKSSKRHKHIQNETFQKRILKNIFKNGYYLIFEWYFDYSKLKEIDNKYLIFLLNISIKNNHLIIIKNVLKKICNPSSGQRFAEGKTLFRAKPESKICLRANLCFGRSPNQSPDDVRALPASSTKWEWLKNIRTRHLKNGNLFFLIYGEKLCATSAKYGRIEILEWLRKDLNCPWDIRTCLCAAKYGHLNIIEFANSNGCPLEQSPSEDNNYHSHKYNFNEEKKKGLYIDGGDCKLCNSVCSYAAKGNQFNILKWSIEIKKCRWNRYVVFFAAANGNFEIFKYAIENQCPYEIGCFEAAAIYGHFNILEYIKNNDMRISYKSEVYINILANGHLNVIKWLKKKYNINFHINANPFNNISPCSIGAKIGRLDIIQWSIKNGYSLNEDTFDNAAQFGDINILKWLKENYYKSAGSRTFSKTLALRGSMDYHHELIPWNENIMSGAVKNFFLVKWLKENGCPWNEYTCSGAAYIGNFELLKWARENGCPWDKKTCSNAARGGHFEILKWCRENKCPWDESTCCFAADSNHFEILQWARKNGCPWNNFTTTYAAMSGNFKIVKWAIENGCPWENLQCYHAFSSCHNNNMAKWLTNYRIKQLIIKIPIIILAFIFVLLVIYFFI
jgi:hypothetical protein